ncbi:gas vesicle protein GvpG [Actinomadura sp. ATCC 31491]|uniref:Gas vesicle protein GvpG n=1 Tax=Actinomadura luzonensis TaxID=2805427 RepID=A0ABT0G9N7_9ACTN|nr:gas vesicle protein GvpG [Actinomadura luzonensis]MCK2221321.1 gas vesicle protein GvpG [Actinomadura luzonensis]
MGLFGAIGGLPLAPVRLLMKLGEVIQQQVEQQTKNPAAIRRKLEEIDAALEAGQISEEEHDEAVRQVLRLATGR